MTMSSEIPSGKMPRRHSKEDWRMSSTIALLWRTSEWIVLLIYLLTVPMVRGYPQFEETNDPGNPAVVLKTMAVDITNGNIYIGSVNRLYRLGSDLSELVAYDTGPVMDNVNCPPPPVECVDDQGMPGRTETDNINKLMLVHNGELLTCSNIYQGSCQRRDLTTLHVIESYTREVVSNFEHGIAIGFIAPGPSGSELYTATPEGDWFRSGAIPTIARRLLEEDPVFGDDPFDFTAQITIPVNTLEEAYARAQYAFNISYVYGFSSGSHSYFVGSQVEEYKVKDSPQRAKIIRVCHQDDAFYSYVELPLTCSSPDGSINYNLAQSAVLATTGSDLGDAKAGEDVLFVTFSASTGESGLEPTEYSAVCMYALKTIDDVIAGRRKECAMATIDGGITEIEWLGNTPCFRNQDVIDKVTEDPHGYCFTKNFNNPLGSNLAIAADAVYTSNDATLTAIMVTPYQKETVIFLGDQQGKLRKLRMTSNTTASLYETIPIDENSAVAQNGLLFDTDKDSIYVMTERKIYKLAVENCSYFSTCEECIGFTDEDGDPYCGWCALERRCTRYDDCDLPDESTRWLSYNETQCQVINNVTPSVSLPIAVPQEITVTVDQLPDLQSAQNYECVFELDDVSVSNSATMSGNDLRCMTPQPGEIPRIPDGTDHIVAILSIRSTETGVKFVSTNYTFFQCSSHARCVDCVASDWDCDWCTYGNVCTHDTGGICPSDDDNTLIAGVKHQRMSPSRRGPSQCTQLEDHPKEVVLTADANMDINITINNLPDVNLVPANSYECILYIEGKEQSTAAERIGDNTVRCYNTQVTYQADIQELTSNLTVHWTWGGSQRTIDDEFGFKVTLFKCAAGSPGCSRSLFRWDTPDNIWRVSENDGTINIPLSREGTVQSKDVEIIAEDLTSTVTATNLVDYELISTTVTFPAGVSNVSVQVRLIDDKDVEGVELFTLTLRDPLYPEGNRGVPYRLIVEIADDDIETEPTPPPVIPKISIARGFVGSNVGVQCSITGVVPYNNFDEFNKIEVYKQFGNGTLDTAVKIAERSQGDKTTTIFDVDGVDMGEEKFTFILIPSGSPGGAFELARE